MAEMNEMIKYNEETDLFYLESDNLALRGNKDYSDLLKTIAILETQRTIAIEDIDKLIEIKNKALENPIEFVKKIKNYEDLEIPLRQKIVEVPEIKWSKFDVQIPEEMINALDEDKIENNFQKEVKECRKPKDLKNSTETFNKHWTSEEQKKLEELLYKFPPEPIEMKRYKKIADALGNRNVKQVTSRIQKYFLKLYKAGLPVPGRIPKNTIKKKAFSHRHQKHNFYLYKPSTFFPDMDVPVVMTENDEDDDAPLAPPPSGTTESYTAKNTVNDEIKEIDEVQIKINYVLKVKDEKMRMNTNVAPFLHNGYKCDKCDEEPIIGCRWHCLDCTESIDFCTDCFLTQLTSNNCHPLQHHITVIRNDESHSNKIENKFHINSLPSTSKLIDNFENDSSSNSEVSDNDNSENSDQQFYDRDYVLDNFLSNRGDYNYLDPNFLPQ